MSPHPATAAECGVAIADGYSKADALKTMHAMCCKPGSQPNGICGFNKIALPCANAADFNGSDKFDELGTCKSMVHVVPDTAAECSEKIGDTPTTKAQMTAYLHSKCCKPGSQPNGVCDSISKATPCQSKAEGEFLPQAK